MKLIKLKDCLSNKEYVAPVENFLYAQDSVYDDQVVTLYFKGIENIGINIKENLEYVR